MSSPNARGGHRLSASLMIGMIALAGIVTRDCFHRIHAVRDSSQLLAAEGWQRIAQISLFQWRRRKPRFQQRFSTEAARIYFPLELTETAGSTSVCFGSAVFPVSRLSDEIGMASR
jgi:hypothetical protein